MQICVNPECRKHFKSSKYNPGRQQVCGSSECRLYLNRKRQQKHYRKHCKKTEWVNKNSKRKQRERNSRQERFRQNSVQPHFEQEIHQVKDDIPNLSSAGLDLLYGLISYLNGITDSREVESVFMDCASRGTELRKKIEMFPNARLASNAPIPNARC